MKEVFLTGIKPTGTPHIGNYFGAIKPAIEASENSEYEYFYFIADYHALTTIENAEELKTHFYEIACTWLACGLDPNKVIFYRQSDIPETFELSCILSNVTAKGILNRAHAYKAMTEKNKENNIDVDFGVNMGIFNYPVLMAADILLFNATKIPVGTDQKQHIEIARDISKSFNKKYGKSLVMPEGVISKELGTLPGLDGRKMSKSYNNIIPLFCSEEELRKIVMTIKTDSSLPNEPKDLNSTIFQLYKLFANKQEITTLENKFLTGISWADAKKELFEKMNSYITPMRKKYEYFMSNKNEVDKLLKIGAEKARCIAKETLSRVRTAIGV